MPDQKVITFGNYAEPDEDEVKGRLTLSFEIDTFNLDELWESSSLSAKFLSTFWGNFFPKHHNKKSHMTRKEVQDGILYISGELLGNAVKFTYKTDFLAQICLYLHNDELRFYVTNSVRPDEIKKFQATIKRILTEDTTELFLEQMEKNVLEENEESGIGYLTLINDYGVELSWKFEERKSGIKTVTIMARLPIIWE